MIRGYRLASGSCGAENTLSGHADTPGIRRPRGNLNDFALASFVFSGSENGRPAADEGIDGGPLPSYPIYPPYTAISGWTVTATEAPAGAAAVVRARTGPDTRAPIVPMVRMAGARMFRRMRIVCLHAFTEVTAQTLVRRPGTVSFARSPVCCCLHKLG